MNIVKILYEGRPANAVDVEFSVESAERSSLKLADGAYIELKHEITAVYRLVDKVEEDGRPIYVVIGKVHLSTTTLEEGKREI